MWGMLPAIFRVEEIISHGCQDVSYTVVVGWGRTKVNAHIKMCLIASLSFDLRTAGLWAQHANHCATMLPFVTFTRVSAII